jgi:hypothetical protein
MSKVEIEENTAKQEKKPKCGIVMPISSIDGCPTEHWAEVLSILKESITQAGFDVNLVSDADDSGIIQKRIIQNLYSNEIVVCDVSGKNPNVMFELGMRLAFDKPTIIVKDDKTDYSFDTSVIEHLTYPRDLRFTKIISFKEALKKKIQGTYEKATNDSSYTTFLKNFGEYKVAQLVEKEVSSDKFILNAIEEIRNEITVIRRNQNINDSFILRRKTPLRVESDKIRIIVGRKIDDFINVNGLNSKKQIFLENRKDELQKYLEEFEDVRDYCGSPEVLRKIIDDIIDPF